MFSREVKIKDSKIHICVLSYAERQAYSLVSCALAQRS